MTRTLRVYVNATGIDVNEGSTALDCVRTWRADEAEEVARGRHMITDSRGLPIDALSMAQAGSIYRTVINRTTSARTD
jgi:hypothetical protein